MELSAEIFQQTLKSLRSDGPIGAKEQRVNPRVGMRSAMRIILRTATQAPTITDVWLHDVSRTGLGLLHVRPISIGSKYVVQFPRTEEPPLTLLCTVMNCRELGKGMWSIGSSFTEIVPSTAWKPSLVAETSASPCTASSVSQTHSDDDETMRRVRAAVIGDAPPADDAVAGSQTSRSFATTATEAS